ncbi:MAG: hypothetical protein ACI8R4_003589, partial [Paracoccaceae bacterium]
PLKGTSINTIFQVAHCVKTMGCVTEKSGKGNLSRCP